MRVVIVFHCATVTQGVSARGRMIGRTVCGEDRRRAAASGDLAFDLIQTDTR
jgi:hypothetical protein